MNVLLLGYNNKFLIEKLKDKKENVNFYKERLSGDEEWINDVDFIVSYGYRYILNTSILSLFPNRAINLHISYLPWNRGADPNLWSFLEDTKKGVTIHEIDSELDTGDILLQEEIQVYPDDTLRSTYQRLSEIAESLLLNNWEYIINGSINKTEQNRNEGTYHKQKDKQPYLPLLSEGWDTEVREIRGKALKHNGGAFDE